MKRLTSIFPFYNLSLFNYLLVFWCFAFLISILIGTVGIVQYLFQKGQNLSLKFFMDTIYYMLSMATLNSLPEDANNVFIFFGRTFSPLILYLLSIQAVLTLIKDRLLLLMAHVKYSGHHIVCGLTPASLSIIQSLRELGRKVIVLEDKFDNPLLKYCKINNIPFMVTDGISLKAYRHLRFINAKEILLLWEDDIRNVYIARELYLEGKKMNKNLNIQVHIKNIWLKHYYDREGVVKESEAKIIPVNIYEIMARAFFLQYPLDEGVNNVENPLIIIIGDGAIATALLIWTILYKVYPEGKDLRISLVGESAKDFEKIFKDRYTYQGEFMLKDVRIDSINIRYSKINSISDLCDEQDRPQAVFVCTNYDDENMRIYEELRTECQENLQIQNDKLKIYCFLSDFSYYMYLKRDTNKDSNKDPNILSIYKLASDLSFNLDEYDRIAKIIHKRYIEQKQKEEHKEAKNKRIYVDADKEWNRLPHVLKTSNRLCADHLWEKLRYIGLKAVYTTDKVKIKEYKEKYKKALQNKVMLNELIYLEHTRYYRERVILRNWRKVIEYNKDKWKELEEREEIKRLTKNTLESYLYAMEELENGGS